MEPLLSKSTNRVHYVCTLLVFTMLIITGLFWAEPLIRSSTPRLSNRVPRVSAVRSHIVSENGIERRLITDNPNVYLCDASFLYHDVNMEPDRYRFSANTLSSSDGSDSMSVQCDDGYTLSCLVSASYGMTSGSADEVASAPNGCGLSHDQSPTKCLEDSVSCKDGRFEGCIDTFHGLEALATSGCSECVAVCKCGTFWTNGYILLSHTLSFRCIM